MQNASGFRTVRALCSQLSVATNRIQGYTATLKGAFRHTFTVGNEVRLPVPEPPIATTLGLGLLLACAAGGGRGLTRVCDCRGLF